VSDELGREKRGTIGIIIMSVFRGLWEKPSRKVASSEKEDSTVTTYNPDTDAVQMDFFSFRWTAICTGRKIGNIFNLFFLFLANLINFSCALQFG
jgi:hypothetical protein